VKLWPFGRKLEQKAHPNGGVLVLGAGSGWKQQTNRKAYLTEGYQQNVVVYRAVRERVQAATAIDVQLYQGDKQVEEHAVLNLLARPNPKQSWDQFLGEMLVNRLLLGESFAVVSGDGEHREIWPLDPLDMEVVPGGGGMPSAYVHGQGNNKKEFPSDPITGESDVFFIKMYNPTDYWRGQSPLMAAAIAGDTFNAGSKWNFSLLNNSARPSGLIRFKGGYPGQEQIQRLREYFKRAIQGSSNAGEVPMLSDDTEWTKMSESPRDMDFINSMKESAKYVASALGVPLPLIDNDASTFNNIEQSKERLYTDTVIPDLEEIINALGIWLLPKFGDDLSFRLDLDSIPALEKMRERKFDRALKAFEKGVLTRQESRVLIGYAPEGDGEFRPFTAIQNTNDSGEEKSAAFLKRLAYG